MNLQIVIQTHGYTQNDFSHAQEPNARTNPTHFQNTTNTQNYEDDVRRQEENLYYQQQLQNAREQAYHDAYIQDLKNRGYIDDNVRKEIQELEEQVEKVKTLQKRREERKKKMGEISRANQEEEER